MTRSALNARAGSPWVRVQRGTDVGGVRLVCVGHAGAGASVFNNWGRAIAGVAELWALQLPGRENRWTEPAETDFTVLTERLYLQLGAYDSRPYALFGVSMGALVAYRLAQLAQFRGNRPPLCLFVASSAGPRRYEPRRYSLHDEADMLRLLRETSASADALVAEPELLSLLFEVLRADLQVCASFRSQTSVPLSCPIVALRGHDDGSVSLEDIVAWHAETSAGFEAHERPGGHLFLFENVAAEIFELIGRVLTAPRLTPT